MTKYKILFILIAVIISINLIQAGVQLNIQNNPVYNSGDVVKFSYSIISDKNINLSYIVGIKCENKRYSFSEFKTKNLIAGSIANEEFDAYSISEDMNNDNCSAYIDILNPYKQTVSKNFKITTIPSINLSINICKDNSCNKKSKVFLKGEYVYLNYQADNKPSISAVLTYPDGKSQNIILPVSIKPSQIGTYKLKVVSSKAGYKTTTKVELFGVIESYANIKSVLKQDLRQYSVANMGNMTNLNSIYNYKVIVFILLTVIIISILVLLKLKRNK